MTKRMKVSILGGEWYCFFIYIYQRKQLTMFYSFKILQNGWAFGIGYFKMANGMKRGFAFDFLFWELIIGFGRYDQGSIENLW